jgi:hypothetical protein
MYLCPLNSNLKIVIWRFISFISSLDSEKRDSTRGIVGNNRNFTLCANNGEINECAALGTTCDGRRRWAWGSCGSSSLAGSWDSILNCCDCGAVGLQATSEIQRISSSAQHAGQTLELTLPAEQHELQFPRISFHLLKRLSFVPRLQFLD